MGAWGPGLYQNDVSEDVKEDYVDRLRRGKTGEEVTAELIQEYQGEINDPEDSINFWCALADVQWNYGRLLPQVKQEALACLSREDYISPWSEEDAKSIQKRTQVLDKLREKLTSPPPPEKKVSKYRLYHCPWKIGDVYALPIDEDFDDGGYFTGRYLLFEKVSEQTWLHGHTIPEVYVKITPDGHLPANVEEYNKLAYVKFSVRNYGSMIFCRPRNELPEDLTELNKEGLPELPEYRIGLVFTSKRATPSKLFLVNHFTGITHPDLEFYPIDSIYMHHYFKNCIYSWKMLNPLRKHDRENAKGQGDVAVDPS